MSARTAVAVDSRLSPPLLRALTLVGTDPGLTLAALAERAQVSRSRASRVCDTLEEAGLLARSPRTEDRRGVGLSLTGRGRRALDRVRAQRTAWIRDALLRMPESDLSGLLAALRSLGPSLAHGHPEHSPAAPSWTSSSRPVSAGAWWGSGSPPVRRWIGRGVPPPGHRGPDGTHTVTSDTAPPPGPVEVLGSPQYPGAVEADSGVP
ncbi:MarR family winged helix-turn-helix transcriptional regulator [Streptomyces sp. NBC_00365]|uniref:MarR family winged helix-turn-helix transcriptional regulator n=1 Tax=Streptomyces sp. NBC_00365 TaxID=2975726 RepID=UPI002251F781|nr:MarR family winged helix-turn-helix transcriptional regulator [Streptomyces sp. NBC_00365]MCX5095209.1 MarR family winged helix-turn-helix transcriptional regulator [Streptomyces sp. NBC_00365]